MKKKQQKDNINNELIRERSHCRIACLLFFLFFISKTAGYAILNHNYLLISMNNIVAADDFDEFDDESNSDSLGFQFITSGFVELENFINTYPHQNPEDINKKNEIRTKLSMQIGTEKYYFKCDPNFYLMPAGYISEKIYPDYRYAENEIQVARNGRLSGKYYELTINECFLNLGFENIRFRLGNQIYAWGTADVFNPTAYINPSDSRELFYRDADESRPGVPSVSSLIFIKDYTLELVYVPVHIGSISPVPGNFWAYHYNLGFMEINGNKDINLPLEAKNMGYGARLATCIEGVDLSLSFYHGPDSSPMLRPMEYLASTSDVLVRQEYHNSTNMGFDFSFKLSDFEFHGEMAYSPDKYGVVDEKYDLNKNPAILEDPFRIKTSHYFSYAVGMNYTWHKLIITSEWLQSSYTDSNLMKPFYSDFLAASISYNFFNEFLNLSLATVYDVKNVGYLILPALSLDFESGVSLKLSYGHLGCKNNEEANMFTLYEKKDIVIVGLKYIF